MRDNGRGTGETTRQMQAAPHWAALVWCCTNSIWYPSQLAQHLGRSDLRIVKPSAFGGGADRLLALRPSEIIFDHAFRWEDLSRDERGGVERVRARMRLPVSWGVDIASPGSERSVYTTRVRTRLPQASWCLLHSGEPVTGTVEQYDQHRTLPEGEWGDLTGPTTAEIVQRIQRMQGLMHDDVRRAFLYGSGPDPETYSRATSAEARARTLLKDWLSPTQACQYNTNGNFTVTGCDTGKLYRIENGRQMNVVELKDDGSPHCKWCFAPALPDGRALATADVMLAQKLALETMESEALRGANRQMEG